MTIKEAKMIERYFDAGYMVKIDSGGYVDSEVTSIMEDKYGKLVYSSEVYDDRPLSEIHISTVSILKPLHEVCTDDRPAIEGEPGYYEVTKVNGEDV
jgi:hypothetical protein